jgi:hypothetical protein
MELSRIYVRKWICWEKSIVRGSRPGQMVHWAVSQAAMLPWKCLILLFIEVLAIKKRDEKQGKQDGREREEDNESRCGESKVSQTDAWRGGASYYLGTAAYIGVRQSNVWLAWHVPVEVDAARR